jgi:UDP-N-acetylmuramoyl-tripeptide--D-alanyl-D-alanine ligase
MFNVKDYAEENGVQVFGNSSAVISRVSTDSRDIKSGDLYVALIGPNFDGHSFINDAFDRGASACMVSTEPNAASMDCSRTFIVTNDTRQGLNNISTWWRKKFTDKVRFIGVTGSNGKTTVKEMIASILCAEMSQSEVLATKGNLNNDIGVPKTLLNLRREHVFAVIEMGMNHYGELTHLTNAVRPDVAVITNIGTAHIGELGSQDGIARAKAEVIAGLVKGGTLVIEADGKYAEYLTGQYDLGSTLTFGESSNAEVRGELDQSLGKQAIKIFYGDLVIDIDWFVNGKHNFLNALAAAAVGFALNISPRAIKRGLELFKGVDGRLETVRLRSGDTLIDDTYNANMDSVCRALEYLAVQPGRKIFVFGDMGELGEFSNAMHEEVGRFAKSLGVSLLYGFGTFAKQAVLRFGSGGLHFDSRTDLLNQLRSELNGQAHILIKGSRFMQMNLFCEALISD